MISRVKLYISILIQKIKTLSKCTFNGHLPSRSLKSENWAIITGQSNFHFADKKTSFAYHKLLFMIMHFNHLFSFYYATKIVIMCFSLNQWLTNQIQVAACLILFASLLNLKPNLKIQLKINCISFYTR